MRCSRDPKGSQSAPRVALVTLHVSGEQILLPIWHEISKDEVVAQTPSLADKIARSTAQYTIDEIATEIASVVRPDLALGTTGGE